MATRGAIDAAGSLPLESDRRGWLCGSKRALFCLSYSSSFFNIGLSSPSFPGSMLKELKDTGAISAEDASSAIGNSVQP